MNGQWSMVSGLPYFRESEDWGTRSGLPFHDFTPASRPSAFRLSAFDFQLFGLQLTAFSFKLAFGFQLFGLRLTAFSFKLAFGFQLIAFRPLPAFCLALTG